MTEIHIPDSVTSIGDHAFDRCRSLTEIHIPDSVTSIGDLAFYGCRSLTEIRIPKSVISMGANPFIGCEQITITCDSPNFYIVDDLLVSNQGKLITCFSYQERIAIPDSVTSIGVGAFDGCSSLTEIHIPDSVTSIGDGAFCECKSLREIRIPDSVTSIDGYYVFYNCESLQEIHIPKGTKEKFKGILNDSDVINKLVEE